MDSPPEYITIPISVLSQIRWKPVPWEASQNSRILDARSNPPSLPRGKPQFMSCLPLVLPYIREAGALGRQNATTFFIHFNPLFFFSFEFILSAVSS